MRAQQPDHGLYAIVLAGGFGRRLAPAVRAYGRGNVPKQFCDFGRGRSLLLETLGRIAPVVTGERTAVVVDASQARRATEQLRRAPGVQLVLQPCDRGTAAGVLLPLEHLLARDPHARVLLTPSDHAVADQGAFRAGLRAAERVLDEGAADAVVFGVESAAPNCDYGWISAGNALAPGVHEVRGFVEKPPPEEAVRLHRAGALWNTMVMLVQGRALREHYRRRLPALAERVHDAFLLPPAARDRRLLRVYPTLPAADFSRDILGTFPLLAVVRWPVTMGWSDLGTPERLATWLGEEEARDASLAALPT